MMALIDLSAVYRLRRELRLRLPGVMSSHIAEAVAAGLGYKSNAAMRAALAGGASIERDAVAEAAFETRLRDLSGEYGVAVAAALREAWDAVTTSAARVAPCRLCSPTDRIFLYRRMTMLLLNGISFPDAAAAVWRGIRESQDPGDEALRAVTAAAADRCSAGAGIMFSFDGMLPGLELLLIDAAERAGCTEHGFQAAAKIAGISPESRAEGAARIVFLEALGTLLSLGFAPTECLDMMETAGAGDGADPQLARMTADVRAALGAGRTLGEALRPMFSVREWMCFGPDGESGMPEGAASTILAAARELQTVAV